MSCDIDYRYRRALQPDGLTTFENALRALNEAVDDVRLAGRQAATCPAVLLLTRHLQRIADGRPTECEADDQALRSQCIERLAELKHRPAIIALVKRGIDYRPEELRHYLALRAYAQPVLSGNQFVPAERDHDRDVLRALQQAQYELRRLGVRMAVKKVLFDITLAAGSARPDFLVALLDEHSGVECKFALQILQSDDADYLELRSIERERLGQAGVVVCLPVSSVTPEAIISEARRILE